MSSLPDLFRATSRKRPTGAGCKVSPEQVREIRALAADPNFDQAEVARRFGISTATVYSIRVGRRRAYVE